VRFVLLFAPISGVGNGDLNFSILRDWRVILRKLCTARKMTFL
jgi:hypothetical protein